MREGHAAAQGAGASGVVRVGVFGAMMDVALVNDGPVTLVIESPGAQTAQAQGAPVELIALGAEES